MIMSVFRQGRPRLEVDHLALMAQAPNADDISMISWAVTNPKPVLASYEDTAAVIKNLEAGDDGLSFEALYDHSLSLRDMRRMRAHNVDSPDKLHSGLFRARLIIDVGDFVPSFIMQLKAKDDADAKAQLIAITRQPEFRAVFLERLVTALWEADGVHLGTTGMLKMDDIAPEDHPDWQFVDDD